MSAPSTTLGPNWTARPGSAVIAPPLTTYVVLRHPERGELIHDDRTHSVRVARRKDRHALHYVVLLR